MNIVKLVCVFFPPPLICNHTWSPFVNKLTITSLRVGDLLISKLLNNIHLVMSYLLTFHIQDGKSWYIWKCKSRTLPYQIGYQYLVPHVTSLRGEENLLIFQQYPTYTYAHHIYKHFIYKMRNHDISQNVTHATLTTNFLATICLLSLHVLYYAIFHVLYKIFVYILVIKSDVCLSVSVWSVNYSEPIELKIGKDDIT